MQNEELNNPSDIPATPIEPEINAEYVPTPNNPPWNGWIALSVWLLSILLIIVFPIIFTAPYLFSQNINISDNKAVGEFLLSDKTAIFLQLLAVFPAHLLTILAAWVVATNFKKYSFRQTLGWEWNGFKIWHAFVISGLFFGLAFGLRSVLPSQENEFDRLLSSSVAATYLVAIFATFTAPLVEEVVYRGILYSALQRRFGIILAVCLVTVLFAAIHIPQYSSNNVPDFSAIILLITLSLVLTLIRVKTDNLLPCIVLHTVFNGIQSIFLILQPFLPEMPSTVKETTGLFLHFLK